MHACMHARKREGENAGWGNTLSNHSAEGGRRGDSDAKWEFLGDRVILGEGRQFFLEVVADIVSPSLFWTWGMQKKPTMHDVHVVLAAYLIL